MNLHLEHPDDRCPWDEGYTKPPAQQTTAQLLEMGHTCRVCERLCREKPVVAGGRTMYLCWEHKVEFLKALRGDLCVACGTVVPADYPDECCGHLYCSPDCLGLHVDEAHPDHCSRCGEAIGREGFCTICVVDDRYV